MSLLSKITARHKVAVGSSDEYGVVAMRATVEPQGPEGQNAIARDVVSLSLDCVALAATRADVPTLKSTIESQLNRRGEAVTVSVFGGAVWSLGAGGSAGGPELGSPACKITWDQQGSYGARLAFTLDVTAVVRRAGSDDGGYEVVSHARRTRTGVGAGGGVTTQVSGEVELANGESAKAYIEAQVLTPAKTAATSAGLAFTSEIDQPTDDASKASYTYTSAPPGSGEFEFPGFEAVGQSTSTVQPGDGGARTLVVQGYATGPQATSYAESKEPSETNQVLVETEISNPSEPEGRVNFRYKARLGTAGLTGFGASVLYSFTESIDMRPGGDPLIAVAYPSADPILYRGERGGWLVTQTTEIEFTGSWADALAGASGLLDDDNLVVAPRPRRSTRNGLRRLAITREYLYATEPTLPDPREPLA